MEITLASQSKTRSKILSRAGFVFDSKPARIDESAIISSLESDRVKPRDIADHLADMKARKVSQICDGLVIGCDQILEFENRVLQKPRSADEAIEQLTVLSSNTHQLLSAVVIYEHQQPVWRFVDRSDLKMYALSPAFIEQYVSKIWADDHEKSGLYEIERYGIRLFQSIRGDYFSILGLPITPIISYFRDRGLIEK